MLFYSFVCFFFFIFTNFIFRACLRMLGKLFHTFVLSFAPYSLINLIFSLSPFHYHYPYLLSKCVSVHSCALYSWSFSSRRFTLQVVFILNGIDAPMCLVVFTFLRFCFHASMFLRVYVRVSGTKPHDK